MEFSLFPNNKKTSYKNKNYIADTLDDLEKIPKNTPDNMVFVIEESKYYILNKNYEWEEK